MKKLLYFILGVLSYMMVLPVLEALVTLLVTAFEIPKGKLSLKIAHLNQELAEIGEEKHQTYAIGFRAPTPADEYEEEEEDY